MNKKHVGVFIDYENVNKVELISEIFAYLNNKGYSSSTRKIVMSKLVGTEVLTETVKNNYLQIALSYKRINKKNNESSKIENKNNADFRFYIEVLDCLYNEDPDGFVFASSDKDYTELVLELKKRDKYLIGIGNKANTSEKYIALFDEFVFTEDLLKRIELREEMIVKKVEEQYKLYQKKLELEKKQKEAELKKLEQEQRKKEQEQKRLEKLKIKEENKKKNEEQLNLKKEKEKLFLNEFGPLVHEYLDTHEPGKYLLSTITSEIKSKHPDKFPKRVTYDMYTKLNLEVKNDTEDKSKAYLEIINKDTPVQ